MKNSLYIYVFLLLCLRLTGQSFVTKNFNLEDGLPSSQVYESWEDGDGNEWFTTDRGVSRFDGEEFTNFTIKDGLVNNVSFLFTSIDSNRFMLNDISGKFSIWNGEHFEAFKYNYILDSINNYKNPSWFNIIHLSEEKIEFVKANGECNLGSVLYSMNLLNGSVTSSQLNDLPEMGDNISPITMFCVDQYLKRAKLSVLDRIDSLFKSEGLYPEGKLVAYIDKVNNIWIANTTGLYVIDKNVKIWNKILGNGDVCSVEQKRNGSYWVTTLNSGVFYIPTVKVKKIEVNDKTIDKIISKFYLRNNSLYAQTERRAIFSVKMEPDTCVEYNYNLDSYRELLLQFRTLELTNGQFLYRRISGFCIEDERPGKKNHPCNHTFVERSISSVEDNQGNVWVGTIKNLYKKDLDSNGFEFTKINIPFVKEDIRINKLYAVDNHIWIATSTHGLLFYQDNIFTKVRDSRLLSEMIHSVYPENDSILWVATNKGLNQIVYNVINSKPVIKSLTSYNSSKGLISDYILDVKRWKGLLFLATNQGICYFDPKNLQSKNEPPKISIKSVYANERIVENADVLEYDKNDITINFSGISMTRLPKTSACFRYTVNNNKPILTKENSVHFSNLSPDIYSIKFEFLDINNIWSVPKFVTFRIKPHFSETIWFRVLVGVLLFGSIIYYFFKREKRNKEKNELLQTYSEIELATLKRQMNPHFIFNSLNTLQGYIFSNKPEEANQYLGEFSRLIRSSFESSMKTDVSLKEEIIFIENYLKFEHKRFVDRFTYEVKYEQSILEKRIFIPSLMIQPLIENAIKHAFRGLKRKGLITVKFQLFNDNHLSVEVVDNGVGNIPKEDINNKHTSFGLTILKKRINLLNTKYSSYDGKIELKAVEDKGTNIQLIIPFDKNI